MRFWAKAGLVLALTAVTAPVVAQSGFGGGSEGESFLEAIRKGDNAKALPFVEDPGQHVVNYKGYDGDTALHIVTRKRELDWVGYLLKEGADPTIPDAKGDTALHIAASIGFDQAVDYIIRMGTEGLSGVDLMARDPNVHIGSPFISWRYPPNGVRRRHVPKWER